MNTLAANVVVAGIDQGHSLREGRQLREVIFSDHQFLQFRQAHERSVLDGRYLVGG